MVGRRGSWRASSTSLSPAGTAVVRDPDGGLVEESIVGLAAAGVVDESEALELTDGLAPDARSA